MYKIPSQYEAYLFDMDGTLVNTEPIGPQVFAALFKEHGVTITPEEKDLFEKVWRRDGTDIKEDDYLTGLVSKYGINKKPQGFIQEFYDAYKVAIVKADELPGVTEFLKQAATGGKHLVIVTSSKRDQAEAVLDYHGWRDLFVEIVSEEDITHFKPDPEPFLVAASKLRVAPVECVVFEDAKNGAISGKAAGMFVIGLRSGNELEQDLSSCDVIETSFTDVCV